MRNEKVTADTHFAKGTGEMSSIPVSRNGLAKCQPCSTTSSFVPLKDMTKYMPKRHMDITLVVMVEYVKKPTPKIISLKTNPYWEILCKSNPIWSICHSYYYHYNYMHWLLKRKN